MKKIYLVARGNSKSMADLIKSYKTKTGKKLLKAWKREKLKTLRKTYKENLDNIKKRFANWPGIKKYVLKYARNVYYIKKVRIKNSILPDFNGYGMEATETYIDEFINKN